MELSAAGGSSEQPILGIFQYPVKNDREWGKEIQKLYNFRR